MACLHFHAQFFPGAFCRGQPLPCYQPVTSCGTMGSTSQFLASAGRFPSPQGASPSAAQYTILWQYYPPCFLGNNFAPSIRFIYYSQGCQALPSPNGEAETGGQPARMLGGTA